jgi:hypothetical protein
MQRLHQLKLVKQLLQAQQQEAAQALVEAESCSVLDVRQWLLAGLLASLKKDAAAVVACSRCAGIVISTVLQLTLHVMDGRHADSVCGLKCL